MSGSLAGTPQPINITFNQIPVGLQVPGDYTEIAANYNTAGLLTYPARALILCPITSTGAAAPNIPVQIFQPQDSDALFGVGGIGTAMCRAFLAANQSTPLWAMGIVNPGGAAAATWTITPAITTTLTGPALSLNLYIGGVQASITVTPGVDTASTIAANLLAAINALPNLPVTAALAGGVITLTARDKGVLPNALQIAFAINPGDLIPGGQTAGVNNLAVPIAVGTAGAGIHSVSTALAAIPSSWFTHMVNPWTDVGTTAPAFSAELARRWNAMTKLDCRAFSFATAANLSALSAIAGGAVINSPFWTIAALQNEPTAPWVVAATYAAVAIFNLLNDPARQLKTLVLPNVKAPASVDILTETEEQTVVTSGLALLQPQNDGTVQILRAATTYQQASGGIPDTTWMDITTAETLARIRYDWNTYCALVYSRNKLAADGTLAAEYDPSVATPRRLHSSWTSRCLLYERLGWIQNSRATAAASIFQLDPSNPNQMDTQLEMLLVNNLMIIANQMIFSLLPAPTTQSAS